MLFSIDYLLAQVRVVFVATNAFLHWELLTPAVQWGRDDAFLGVYS